MMFMKSAQCWAVTGPYSQAAPARTLMMPSVAMFEKKANDRESIEVPSETERVDVMPQYSFVSVRSFFERMTSVCFPIVIPV